MDYQLSIQIREAIQAGEQALSSLRESKSYLQSAGNWGLLDILGGGFVVNLIKHSKVNDASRCMEKARNDIRRFRNELDDVDDYLPNIQVGDFLTFADFFFDGFVADVMMQSKIGKARRQVDEAMYQVESIVNRLRYELTLQ